MRTHLINSRHGKKIMVHTTAYVDEEVDVTAELDFSEILDDIIESMDEEHISMIQRKIKTTIPTHDFSGDELKRHLCDILNERYYIPTNKLLEKLEQSL